MFAAKIVLFPYSQIMKGALVHVSMQFFHNCIVLQSASPITTLP